MEEIKITINEEEYNFPKGITLEEISQKVSKNYNAPILVGFIDNEMYGLDKTVEKNSKVTFLTYLDRLGNRIYQKSLVFLLVYAFKELYGYNYNIKTCHSIDNSIKIKSSMSLTPQIVEELKTKMQEITNKHLEIKKCLVTKKDAIKYFTSINDLEKVKALSYITDRTVTLYKLEDMYDYFYTIMPINTEVFDSFDLKYLNESRFLLQYPVTFKNGSIPEYKNIPLIDEAFHEDYKLAKRLNIHTSSDINTAITKGTINDIIKLNEVISSNKLLELAKEIDDRKDKIKIVLIAGPSSSGKTTTARKLSMYLKSFGLNPKALSTDDYFIPREKTPKLPNGDYDYESINSIDLKLFNEHLTKLLNNEEVKIPTFNFYKGVGEYLGNTLKLEKNDILIIEGLHCLNEKLTESIPKENKFKVYISPLSDLNIDNHNMIATSDIRLLRRMVRDSRTRGYSAEHTIKIWRTVRKGEEQYIFPYQNEASYVFNTAFIYELGIIKPYAEALLYSINTDSEYYEEARRLLKLLSMFLTIPSDMVPNDSILREFIGNSYFE